MASPGEWLADQFELNRGGTSNVRAMEGLRGFAVLLVFFVHYATLVRPWLPPRSAMLTVSDSLGDIGHSGVDLFFVLSGYLIYGSLIRRMQGLGHFWVRRIQRIYPAFLAVFAIYLVLSALVPTESKIPHEPWPATWYLVENLLLLPGILARPPMITVTWSLSYEMFFYLVIPVAIGAFGLRAWTSTRRLIFLSVAALVFVACSAWLGGPVRLVMFIGGMILYEVMQTYSTLAPSTGVAVAAVLLGWLPSVFIGRVALGGAPVTMALLLSWPILCLLCLARPASPIALLATVTPLRWLGNMSYSYYLLHAVTARGFFLSLQALWPSLRPAWPLWFWLLPPAFAISLIPAAVVFLLVERPFSLAPRAPSAPVVRAAGAG